MERGWSVGGACAEQRIASETIEWTLVPAGVRVEWSVLGESVLIGREGVSVLPTVSSCPRAAPLLYLPVSLYLRYLPTPLHPCTYSGTPVPLYPCTPRCSSTLSPSLPFSTSLPGHGHDDATVVLLTPSPGPWAEAAATRRDTQRAAARIVKCGSCGVGDGERGR